MDLTREERPPATRSKVPVWLGDAEGNLIEGSYAESLCDAGTDAQGYWYDASGNVVRPPVRWCTRPDGGRV